MKANLLLMLTTLILSVSSCSVNLGSGAEIVEPSEKIVKAKYPQAPFDKIESHVVGNIQLVQSDNSRVTLSAPENYIDFFEFKNKDGKLDINFTKGNVNFDAVNITILIYTPTLKMIKNSGAADIRLDSLVTDEFEIDNSGVGSFQLNHLYARRIDVSCSGVGSISVDGKVDRADYSCTGVGSINAEELKAREVEAKVSGVGSINCYASDYIKGSVTGVGGLKYAGHPAKKDLNHPLTGGIKEL